MGWIRRDAHGCSYPGCKEPVTHDLKLTRRAMPIKRYSPYNRGGKPDSTKTLHHLYLCDKHWSDMYDFMEYYEGKE